MKHEVSSAACDLSWKNKKDKRLDAIGEFSSFHSLFENNFFGNLIYIHLI